jgi:hypothetical protein
MKKLVISGIVCLILFGGFYYYKKTTTPVYVYSDEIEEAKTKLKVKVKAEEKSTKDSVVTPKSSLDELKETVAQQIALTNDLTHKLTVANDSIYALNKTVNKLKEELGSKPKIKIQSSPYDNATPVVSNVNKNKTVKKSNKTSKNEKNLPIARGNDAVKLQEFFTDRYDNR